MIKRNKKPEFVMKDYAMIGLLFALIFASVYFIIDDMNKNEGIGDNVNISEIQRFYDEDYVDDMEEKTTSRLDDLQDAGFFQTLFLTTLEIVEMIPRLITMTVGSVSSVTSVLLSSESAIPRTIATILSIMIFAGLLWGVVYFIRRLSK